MVPEVAGGIVAGKHFRRLLSKVDVVSFDVFGTLLERACVRPEFVFDFAFARWSGLPLESDGPFARARSAADDSDVFGRPMTLDEIYERIPCLTYGERSEIKRLEVECERRVLFARSDVREMYEMAASLGKRIVAVSDMYLPSEVIAEMLVENGYLGIERVYVSCEHGCEKGDGRLLAEVSRELGVEPGRILHIGDTLNADIKGSCLSKVSCAYVGDGVASKIAGRIPMAKQPVDTGIGELLGPGIASLCVGRSRGFAIGCKLIGPFVYGFCLWLHRMLDGQDINRILFMARDARLMYEAYNALFPADRPKTRYIHCSRRACNSALLQSCRTVDDKKTLSSHGSCLCACLRNALG